MQTRLGLRTVRKSGSDVSHDAPQSVSPFHPPVKLDEKQLKQVVTEERPAKRRSTRLNNDNKNNKKDGQRTLFDSFTPAAGQIEKSHSTAISKKRTTSTTTKESVIEHQPKKQRINNNRKNQQHHEKNEQETVSNIVQQQQQQAEQKQQASVQEETVVEAVAVEQSRAEAQEVPVLSPVTTGLTPTTTVQASLSLSLSPTPPSALLPTASPLSSPEPTTRKELANPDVRPSIVDKEQKQQQSSNYTEPSEVISKVDEPARAEKSIERPASVEKTEVHEARREVNTQSRDHNASSSASQPVAEAQEVPAWKRSFYIQSDQARVQDEKSTLHKVRNALDVSLMFHAANQRIAMFHKIQPMLRNTTKKNITIAHLAKILYLAPMLYRVEPKILGQQGKEMETYAVELGSDWKAPLSGKQLEERENILEDKMEGFFNANKGKLVIPEKELPRIDKVVDRKKWIETANLPSGVRDLLQLEERRKEEAEKAKATQPPLTGTGTVKDRRQALLERIRAKSKK